MSGLFCMRTLPAYERLAIYPTHDRLTVHHRPRRQVPDDDKQHGDLVFHSLHCCYRLVLDYLAAGFAAAGVAAAGAASTLAGVLFAGTFFSSFLTSGFAAGALAAGAGAAAFGASAAKADIANTADRATINDFILISLGYNTENYLYTYITP